MSPIPAFVQPIPVQHASTKRPSKCVRSRSTPKSVSAPPPPRVPPRPSRSSPSSKDTPPLCTHVSSAAELSTAIAVTPHLLMLEVTKPGCRACMRVNRAVERLAGKYAGRVTFVTMDGYELPEVAQKLGVRAMPTFIVYSGGRRIDHFATSCGDTVEMYITDNL